MRDVPWWGVISSLLAPVLLVTGFTVAASLQPDFDPISGTVSSLAAVGATDRWVMTLTFVVVGLCYLVSALALRPAGTAGRLILAAAGMSWPRGGTYHYREEPAPAVPETSAA
jgi:hypothetical membrane protein